MTVEEIKESISMKEVLSRYGIEVKKNMCCCPIHKERHPSMQIFKDGYHCYACGAHGGVIKFIQEMESCDFKTAFLSLGGTYEKHSNEKERKLIKKRYERQRKEREDKARYEKTFVLMLSKSIAICRDVIQNDEPYTDDWCTCVNALDWLIYIWEKKYIRGEGIKNIDVVRMCKRIERIRHIERGCID